MLRATLACVLSLLATFPATARCEGRNQIAALPAATRAELTAAVDAVPFPRGNLWRATRGDQVLHLIGTYHLDDPRHDAIMSRLTPLIETAATVLVEAGPQEEQALQAALARDPSLMFVMNGPTLPEVLPPATWDRLKDALRARAIPPFLGAKMQPAYLSMVLGIPPCASEMFLGGENGLDKRIIAAADTAAVPLGALEPFDTLFRAFAGMTDTQQHEMLEMSLAMESQSEDAFATMQDSYFAEDSRMIWEFSRWQTLQIPGMGSDRVQADFAMMEEALMAARNRAWIPVIETALKEGRVFAAFGALHLSGQDGVLALLERAGFSLTRLPL